MNQVIKEKLALLPTKPGVYFHKDNQANIIYIGKAANLKNRVKQYFHSSKSKDLKTAKLVEAINDIDWIVVDSEIDALFLEAELVRRYLPKFNILLRDDKSLSYIRINYNDKYPSVSFTRRPLDDRAKYFGPYTSKQPIIKALKLLRKIFPYSLHGAVIPSRVCLDYHLGLCPGLEENKTSIDTYRTNLRRLMKFMSGAHHQLIDDIESDMKKAAKDKDYENAAIYRNQIVSLKSLSNSIVFSDKENLEISKDEALIGLREMFNLVDIPKRIEGFDISHMQGTNTTASMVVFINGVPEKKQYRKFNMLLPGNNDFGHIQEVIGRRLSPSNVKRWPLPDIFLIDGGKGQLSSAIKARNERGIVTPMIGIAKREEEIVIDIN
ncbi:MAG TPA: UvrB/UvrC motif-containing protein, partial [Candidatus Saccharimonadia bacterium]|nr:UvrB/UvrC motif-containing protein [Candidatus Saccharimonadia bacterium]